MLDLISTERYPEMLGFTVFLSIARITPFVFINPIFSRQQFQSGILQMSIILALSLPVFPSVFFQLNAYGIPSVFTIAALVLKEMVIGLMIAILLSIPLWAIDGAGKFIEGVIGFNAATESEISGAIGDLFLVLTFLFLFSTDWFNEIFLNAYYQSYSFWPPLAPLPEPVETILFDIIAILDHVSMAEFLIALPIVAIILLADIVVGLLLKFTQAINPNFLMFSVKPLIFIVLLFPFVTVLMILIEKSLAELETVLPALEGLLPSQTGGHELER